MQNGVLFESALIFEIIQIIMPMSAIGQQRTFLPCSWDIQRYASRQYFMPNLKVHQRYISMKPDTLTGAFMLDDGFALSKTTTRTEFLSSQIGRESKALVKNEPWCSFRFTVSSPSLAVAVFFKGEDLDSIQVAVMDSSAKAEWSLEGGMARKKVNNSWLMSVGLNPGSSYPWGSVWSDYDPKGGFSSVVIRYANRS